jgi:hypothetical protein
LLQEKAKTCVTYHMSRFAQIIRVKERLWYKQKIIRSSSLHYDYLV